MTGSELMDLLARLVEQLGLGHVLADDGTEIALDTEDGAPLYLGVVEVTDDESGHTLFLTSSIPVVEGISPDLMPFRAVAEATSGIFGKVVIQEDGDLINLVAQQQCIGWPGAAELQETWNLLVESAELMRPELLAASGGNAPKSYEELFA